MSRGLNGGAGGSGEGVVVVAEVVESRSASVSVHTGVGSTGFCPGCGIISRK